MRRFRLLDIFVLTSAIAVAFAMFHALESVRPASRNLTDQILRGHALIHFIATAITWALSFLVLADSPRRKASFRAPGKLALVLMLATSVVSIAMNWDVLFNEHLPVWLRIVFLPFEMLSNPVVPACVTVSAWLMLRLTDLPRPPSDWLEISGRIAGWIWIAFAIARPLLDLQVMLALGLAE